MSAQKFKTFYLNLTVFMTGASILVLEILGTRIINPFYGATIFVWTSLITITMGALAVGYFVGGKIIDKNPKISLLSKTMFLAGVFFLIPMKIDQLVLPATDKFGLKYGPLVASFLLFFIPLMLLGMISPMAIRLITKKIKLSGSYAGQIFALSTVGSIVGGLLAGFYLINKLTITQSLSGAALGLVIMAMIGSFFLKQKRFTQILLMLIIALIVLSLPKYRYKENSSLSVLHHEQGFYGDLKVIETPSFRCVNLDGNSESCVRLQGEQVSPLFHDLAHVINEHKPKNVLILGSGGGNLIMGGIDKNIKIDIV